MAKHGLVETYRGAVGAWECDAFGHLNVAFYPDRFVAAAADLLERLHAGMQWRTVSLDTRYLVELRASEGVVIRSGLLSREDTCIRIAHEALAPSGGRTTLAEHVLEPEGGTVSSGALVPADFAWDRFAAAPDPAGEGPIASGRDRVRDGEAEAGRLSPAGHVHRFSDACLLAIDAIGMTDAYRRRANRGFATFETRLTIAHPAACVGDGIAVTSGIAAIGTSSLRLEHRMRATRDGRVLARFHQAGVHFDLAARRSSPWPEELRSKALALRIVGE
ncbi:MAG TPA: thioesterase family protein [Stellaceae bacterium]|nr:thioesterase family protein [Stellaceae bacterium]